MFNGSDGKAQDPAMIADQRLGDNIIEPVQESGRHPDSGQSWKG